MQTQLIVYLGWEMVNSLLGFSLEMSSVKTYALQTRGEKRLPMNLCKLQVGNIKIVSQEDHLNRLHRTYCSVKPINDHNHEHRKDYLTSEDSR